jgi:hypothetical protein
MERNHVGRKPMKLKSKQEKKIDDVMMRHSDEIREMAKGGVKI